MRKTPYLRIASWNLRALMRPGYTPWPDQPPYSPETYAAKLEFLEEKLRRFDADVVGVQEVAEPEAFDELQARLAGLYPHHVVGERGSGSGLRVGVLSRYPVEETTSHWDFPPEGQVRLEPEGEPVSTSFRRPVLSVRLTSPAGPLTIVNVHLKAKRPDYFEDEAPSSEEDENPVIRARAMGRSLVVRGGEAVGLRALLTELQHASKGSVVLLGDFNDGPESVTTQILGRGPHLQRPPKPEEFYSTLEMQRRRRKGPHIYTHIWEGNLEVLDHIVVSGDLAGRFEELRCFNDFLEDAGADSTLSDHGALVASFRASHS